MPSQFYGCIDSDNTKVTTTDHWSAKVLGDDIYVAGIAESYYDFGYKLKEKIAEQDTCVVLKDSKDPFSAMESNAGTHVLEAACWGLDIYPMGYLHAVKCPFGCENGACLRERFYSAEKSDALKSALNELDSTVLHFLMNPASRDFDIQPVQNKIINLALNSNDKSAFSTSRKTQISHVDEIVERPLELKITDPPEAKRCIYYVKDTVNPETASVIHERACSSKLTIRYECKYISYNPTSDLNHCLVYAEAQDDKGEVIVTQFGASVDKAVFKVAAPRPNCEL